MRHSEQKTIHCPDLYSVSSEVGSLFPSNVLITLLIQEPARHRQCLKGPLDEGHNLHPHQTWVKISLKQICSGKLYYVRNQQYIL